MRQSVTTTRDKRIVHLPAQLLSGSSETSLVRELHKCVRVSEVHGILCIDDGVESESVPERRCKKMPQTRLRRRRFKEKEAMTKTPAGSIISFGASLLAVSKTGEDPKSEREIPRLSCHG